jgi:hypothetical protein
MLLSGRSVGALMPVGRSMSEVPVMIVRSTYRSTAILAIKRPLLRRNGQEAVNQMQQQIQLMQTQVLSALNFKELLSHSNNPVIESAADTVSLEAASVAGSVRSESRAESFTRPSTVGHCLSVQLARDDLDSILAA